MVNAASYSLGYASPFPNGAVAPGEIVTIFGNGLPEKPTVNFGQFPAPVLYASACQINTVVPFEVTPGSNTLLTLQSAGETIGPVEVPVVAAAPGLFTMTQNGTGQAAILNQDNSVNSASNPAPRGTIVAVYLTGTGDLTPAIPDGSLGPLTAPFPAPVAVISVNIGEVAAPLLFVGQAPGLIAGATQVNVQVPANAPTGVVPITIYAAYYASQLHGSVTMAVQ
jgi:uncharacterized protein (TIGR03437 family)